MSVTAVKHFATKESVISAIRWTGTGASYNEIKYWLGDDVQLRDGSLFVITGKRHMFVEVGNYIAVISGSMFSFTPEELADDYVAVTDQAL